MVYHPYLSVVQVVFDRLLLNYHFALLRPELYKPVLSVKPMLQ